MKKLIIAVIFHVKWAIFHNYQCLGPVNVKFPSSFVYARLKQGTRWKNNIMVDLQITVLVMCHASMHHQVIIFLSFFVIMTLISSCAREWRRRLNRFFNQFSFCYTYRYRTHLFLFINQRKKWIITIQIRALVLANTSRNER